MPAFSKVQNRAFLWTTLGSTALIALGVVGALVYAHLAQQFVPFLVNGALLWLSYAVLAGGGAIWFSSRGRLLPAIYLLVVGNLLAIVVTVTQVAEVTWPMILNVWLLLTAILLQTKLQREQIRPLVALVLVGTLLVVGLDWFGASGRIALASRLQSWLPALVFMQILALGIVTIRYHHGLLLQSRILLAFMLVTAFATGLVTLISNFIAQTRLTQSAGEDLLNVAKTQALAVGDQLDQQFDLLDALVLNKTLQDTATTANRGQLADPADLLAQQETWSHLPDTDAQVQAILNNNAADELREFQAIFPNHLEMWLTNQAGMLVAASKRPAQGNYYGNNVWWTFVAQQGQLHVAQPNYDDDDGAVILMAVPLRSHNSAQLAGVLISEYRVQALNAALNVFHTPRLGESRLYFADGQQVLANGQFAKATPEVLAMPLGSFTQMTYEGQESFVGRARLAATDSTEHEALIASLGWSVVASQPSALALEPARAATQGSLVVSAIALMISGLIAVGATQALTAPLRQLTNAAQQLAAGDLDHRVKIVDQHDELGLLARAFNTMADAQQERLLSEQLARAEAQRLQVTETQMREQLEAWNANLEQTVAARTHDLTEANTQAKNALIEAERANETKSVFLANMSHELRTPLTVIIGYTEVLLESLSEAAPPRMVARVKRIHESAQHLLALISDILDFSKIEAGRMELYPETFELTKLLEEVTNLTTPLVEKNQNQLVAEWPTDLGQMHADQTKTRQILLNLLSNAAKFTEKGQVCLRVQLELRGEERWLKFEVQDTGIGLRPEQAAIIFNAFQQADTSSTRKFGGTGLGLTISRRLAQMMQGDITLTSEYGRGSTFTLYLPQAGQFLAQPHATPDAGSLAPPTANAPTVGTVLIIDDDHALRELIAETFIQAHYQVFMASSGAEGLEQAARLRPDLITLDVLMPGMDGWTVLAALKANPDLQHIPVLMLTIIEDKKLGFAIGASDYLLKPINRAQLLRTVAKYTPRPPTAQTPTEILVVDDDASLREMLAQMLQNAGWQVVEAANGRAALDQVAQRPPALILLDLMMPEMDGFQFLANLRQQPAWQKIPVVVVSAMELTREQHQQLNQYVEGLIHKGQIMPGSSLMQEVRAHVQQYLHPPIAPP